jgi:outer membrane lipoprotein-sorting protein
VFGVHTTTDYADFGRQELRAEDNMWHKTLLLAAVLPVALLFGRSESDEITFTPRTTATLAPDEAQRFLDEVAERLGTLKTIRADFLQQRQMAAFVDTLTAHGTCHYQAPDKIRWEMKAPYRSALVFNAGRVAKFVYDENRARKLSPGSKEVLQEVLKLMSFWMRGDFASSRELFEIEIERDDFCRIVLSPRSPGTQMLADQVVLTMGATRRDVARLTVTTGHATRVFTPADAVQLGPDDARLQELAGDAPEVAQGLGTLIPQWLQGNLTPSQELFTAQSAPDRAYRVRLTPRSPEMRRILRGIELTLAGESKLVEQVLIREERGDRIVISFTDQKVNNEIDPGSFALD